MQKTKHMPADMTSDIIAKTTLDQFVRLSLLVHAVHHKTFHGQGFAMIGKLLENGISSLHTFLVLLLLIASNKSSKKRCFLSGKS